MILAISILTIILSIYVAGNYLLYTIPLVEAGPISGVKSTGLQKMPVRINSSYTLQKEGQTIKYRRFIIQGNCMVYRGLKSGEMINVRIYKSDNEKKKLTQGDIVLIYLNDKNFRGYKIRAISNLLDNSAETHYYNTAGTSIPSSKNHALTNIIGIIEGPSIAIAA